jgi:hypothetical protein
MAARLGDRVRVAKYGDPKTKLAAKVIALCHHTDAKKTWAVVAIPGRDYRAEARDMIELEAA